MDVRGRRGAMLVSGVLLAAGSAAGLQVAASGAVERGAGGVTTRVSVADDGTEANSGGAGRSGEPAISADGRYVAFVSRTPNLVPGDTNDVEDVFVRDRRNGTTWLASVSSGGVPGTGPSGERSMGKLSISSDGRFVAFGSAAPNLVPGDTNDAVDIFVRDLQTETTERVSIGDAETQLVGSSVDAEISGNGRFVIFHDAGALSGSTAGFVRDRAAGTTQSIPGFVEAAISERGRFVAFSTDNRLTPNDRDRELDVYVLDRQTGTRRLASTTGSLTSIGWSVSMSGNGRFVAYEASPTPNGTADTQIFVRDMRTKTARIVSVNSRGVRGNGRSTKPALSRDGHYVAFWSASTNLDPRTARSVYGHDLRTGVTRTITVNSSGRPANRRTQADSLFKVPVAAVSGTGRVIAFHSPATNLVPHDLNGDQDVFVRVQRLR